MRDRRPWRAWTEGPTNIVRLGAAVLLILAVTACGKDRSEAQPPTSVEDRGEAIAVDQPARIASGRTTLYSRAKYDVARSVFSLRHGLPYDRARGGDLT